MGKNETRMGGGALCPQTLIGAESATNSPYYKLTDNELIVSFGAIISEQPENSRREIVAQIASIFGNHSTLTIFTTLCKIKASTISNLELECHLDKTNIVRALADLHRMKIAFPVGKVHTRHMSGPKPMIWAIIGYKPEHIANAESIQQRISSPIISTAEKIAQLLLDDYFTPRRVKEASINDIMPYIRKGNSGFPSGDLITNVTTILKKWDIIIWR